MVRENRTPTWLAYFPNLMCSRQQPNELTILIPTQLKLTHLKPTHLLNVV